MPGMAASLAWSDAQTASRKRCRGIRAGAAAAPAPARPVAAPPDVPCSPPHMLVGRATHSQLCRPRCRNGPAPGLIGGAAVPQSDGVNGVRTGRPRTSSRDSHGPLCRDRRVGRFYSFQTQAYSLLSRDFGPTPLPLCTFRLGRALGSRLAWLWRRQDAFDGALEYLARLFDAQLAGGFDEACRLLGIVHLWGRGLGLVVRAAGHGSQDAAL